MALGDTDQTWAFHNLTKYVPGRTEAGEPGIMMGVAPRLGPALGEQDTAIEPLAYKIYESLEPIPLPRPDIAPRLTALDAIAATGDLAAGQAVPDLAILARLLLRSNGVLKRWRSPWGKEIEFRAAGCTGARFHLELYVVCQDLDDLAAGVYHYAAHDHSLRLLRSGDHRALVIDATGAEPAVATAPVILICTSTFWRNAWRYQERTYRHVFWDVGTLFTNLLAVAADAALPAKVVLGYADGAINALLDIDGEDEAAVALLAVGRSNHPVGPAPAITPLGLSIRPLSVREIEFPAIGAMHRASSLASGEEARAWRSQPWHPTLVTPSGPLTSLHPLTEHHLPRESIDGVINRRRSNRHYLAEIPVSFAAFSTALDRATRGSLLDCLDLGAPPLHDIYLIINNVADLAAGSYVYRPAQQALELLAAGDFRADAARLACGQAYAAAVNVNVYAMTDLRPVLAHYGNRGYRLAQVEAALFGGKLQLVAHALGLGAVGSTSFDDDVTAFFSPDAAEKSFMFVAVFGHRRPPSTDEKSASSRFLRGDRAGAPTVRTE